MKKYGKYIKISDSIPHSIMRLFKQIKLRKDGTVETSGIDFLKDFQFDGAIRDSNTGREEVKTKYGRDHVILLSSDGFFGWVKLLPDKNPNNILLGFD